MKKGIIMVTISAVAAAVFMILRGRKRIGKA